MTLIKDCIVFATLFTLAMSFLCTFISDIDEVLVWVGLCLISGCATLYFLSHDDKGRSTL